jgi:hypothetical protein
MLPPVSRQDRHVLDEMDSPMGRVALVAYGDGGSVWVGIDRVDGEPLGAIELRSGSTEGQMTGTATVYPTWALAWGAVAPGIVRAGVRNEEGETFPARIVPLPAELEREYRAVWGIAEPCRSRPKLVGYDEDGMLFDEDDPRPFGPVPTDLQRFEQIRRHVHDGLRYYATAHNNETDENREGIRSELATLANVMAIFEIKSLDPRSMIARRQKIIDRYLESARLDPWKPPQAGPDQPS